MRTLIVKYPDEVQMMVISHLSERTPHNFGLGVCGVCTKEMEAGLVEIDLNEGLIDNATGEKVEE